MQLATFDEITSQVFYVYACQILWCFLWLISKVSLVLMEEYFRFHLTTFDVANGFYIGSSIG